MKGAPHRPVGARRPLTPGPRSATTAADPLPATAPAAALDLDAFRRWCSLVPAPKALLTRLLARVGSSAADEGGVRAAGAGGARDAGRAQHAAAPSSATPGAPHTPAEPPLPLELPRIVAQAAATPAAAAAPDAAAPVSSNAPPQLPRGCLLRPEWVWLLAPGLAPAMRREWRLLFSSAKHGASFSTLLGRLGGAAPTLLLVRDHGGRVFGGVAHAPWRRAGAFYGGRAWSVRFTRACGARPGARAIAAGCSRPLRSRAMLRLVRTPNKPSFRYPR